jgi:hypothetical protein
VRDLVSVLENSSKFSGSNCLIVACRHNQRISGEYLETWTNHVGWSAGRIFKVLFPLHREDCHESASRRGGSVGITQLSYILYSALGSAKCRG